MVDLERVLRVLTAIASPPHLRRQPRAGDLEGDFTEWFDGGAIKVNTGWTEYHFADGTMATVPVTPLLGVSIQFGSGERVEVSQVRVDSGAVADASAPGSAHRTSRDTKPLGPMAPFPYAASFSRDQYATMRRGLIPKEMEEKWFIFWEDDALFFHRSWTGHGIYRVRFRAAGDRFAVAEASVATGVDYYRRGPDADEAALVDFLIRGLLLGEAVEFPIPSDLPADVPLDVYQHHMTGTAFPMRPPGDSAKQGLMSRLMRWLRRPRLEREALGRRRPAGLGRVRTHTDRDVRMMVARSHGQPLDLAGANLEMANLPYVDLRGANLVGANLRGAMLWGALLDGARLDGADLTCANLTWSSLCGCSMKDALLVAADLDEALVPWTLGEAVTAGAVGMLTINPCRPSPETMSRVTESLAAPSSGKEAQQAREDDLLRAHLESASPALRARCAADKHKELRLAKARVLSDSDLEELLRWSVATDKPLNLRGCNLSGASLRNACLRRACLAYTDATGADIRGADLAGADLYQSCGWER